MALSRPQGAPTRAEPACSAHLLKPSPDDQSEGRPPALPASACSEIVASTSARFDHPSRSTGLSRACPFRRAPSERHALFVRSRAELDADAPEASAPDTCSAP